MRKPFMQRLVENQDIDARTFLFLRCNNGEAIFIQEDLADCRTKKPIILKRESV